MGSRLAADIDGACFGAGKTDNIRPDQTRPGQTNPRCREARGSGCVFHQTTRRRRDECGGATHLLVRFQRWPSCVLVSGMCPRLCTLRLGMLDHLTSFPFCSCVFLPGGLPAASLSLGKQGVARNPHGHGLDVVASGVSGTWVGTIFALSPPCFENGRIFSSSLFLAQIRRRRCRLGPLSYKLRALVSTLYVTSLRVTDTNQGS